MLKKENSTHKCTFFIKKIISLLLLIVWLGVIFSFSNQTGEVSGSASNGILYSIFENIYELFNLNKNNLSELINLIENPIRELMHSFEYLILAILFINVLINFNINNKITVTILFIFIAASFDEIHQLFIKGRSFEYLDIFMDMIGCFIAIVIYKIFILKKLENWFLSFFNFFW